MWIVDNTQEDEWFADLPVVICFDRGSQLEVCWKKLNDLSLTWNTIDVGVTPRCWVEWPLEWRRNAHPQLLSAIGATVTEITATAFDFTTHALESEEHTCTRRGCVRSTGTSAETVANIGASPHPRCSTFEETSSA